MTFSDFAQMMYPIIGNGVTTWEFVIQLTNHIMEIPSDNNDEYNPLSQLDISTLGKIYSGKRNLSRRNAIAINSHLDKSTFHNYLMDFPTDITVSIIYALQEKQIEITNDDPIEACTDLFVSIIQNCANRKKQINPQNSDHFMDQLWKKDSIWYAQLMRNPLWRNILK
ncbi:hypothetical protein D7V94_22905 [Parablautia intestinalis]|uniref:Uncharacterized protein n=1 Tax=Parablautia intestinalis TaxID=2320100 RepID=A0A3A9AEP3_9FIRM|nr:hypothetical protein [Parablautia intestinalis]RKI85873.1 hypothetical protein D7V94_22905 [Parablautia intestinalis]